MEPLIRPPLTFPLTVTCHGPTPWVSPDIAALVPRQKSLFDTYEYACCHGIYLWAVQLAPGLYRVPSLGKAEKTARRVQKAHAGASRQVSQFTTPRL